MITTEQRRITSCMGHVRGDYNDTYSLVIANSNHTFYDDVRSSVWTIRPLDTGFQFYMQYA